MMLLGKSPFDDASGQQLLGFLSQEGVGFQPASASLTASGTVIGDALQLQVGTNYFGTVASGKAAKLPDVPLGSGVIVVNAGANTLKVFPPNASTKIGIGATAGASVNLTATSVAIYFKVAPNQYIVK